MGYGCVLRLMVADDFETAGIFSVGKPASVRITGALP